jgi:hypothetical protein
MVSPLRATERETARPERCTRTSTRGQRAQARASPTPAHAQPEAAGARRVAQLLTPILGHSHFHGRSSRAAVAATPATTHTPQPPHRIIISPQARQGRAHTPDTHTRAPSHAANHTHTHGNTPATATTAFTLSHAHSQAPCTQTTGHTRHGARATRTQTCKHALHAPRTRRTQQNHMHNLQHCTLTFDHPIPLTGLGQPGRTRAIWPAARPHARELAGHHHLSRHFGGARDH